MGKELDDFQVEVEESQPEVKPLSPVLKTLIDARALISDSKRWCQNALAVNRAGIRAYPEDDDAIAWCSIGALRRSFNGALRVADALLDSLPDYKWDGFFLNPCEPIAKYNDTHSHAEVLALFDSTIERLRNE